MSETLPCDKCHEFPCGLMTMDGMTILEALKVCRMDLTEEEAKLFVEALDAEPNEELIKAAERFKRLSKE